MSGDNTADMYQDSMDLDLEVEPLDLVFQSLSSPWKRDDEEDDGEDDWKHVLRFFL